MLAAFILLIILAYHGGKNQGKKEYNQHRHLDESISLEEYIYEYDEEDEFLHKASEYEYDYDSHYEPRY